MLVENGTLLAAPCEFDRRTGEQDCPLSFSVETLRVQWPSLFVAVWIIARIAPLSTSGSSAHAVTTRDRS
jgi:hypothetical protein